MSPPGRADIDDRTIPVEIDTAGARFLVRDGEQTASLTFRVRDTTLVLIHTEVPPPLRGRKVGIALTRAALEYARGRGLTVRPLCPFVKGYIDRHPEYQDLVDGG